MNQLHQVKNKVLSSLTGGNILFIIPPFTNNSPVIGPHILQAIAQQKGFKTEILYLNLLLASIIGYELSEKLGASERFQYWSMLNERLFARSAYGLPPLGNSPESCNNEAMSVSGNQMPHRRMDYETEQIDLKKLRETEKICAAFVDEVIPAIASLPYKIVGCTTRMGQTNCSIAILNGLKRIRPDITAIIGGSNCQNEMAEGIASLSDAIDYIFSGESELSFGKFLDGHSVGEFPPERIIAGKPLENLDSLQLMNYDGYFRQFGQIFGDNAPKPTHVWLETSRGCWWGQKIKCAFCSRNNDNIKFRKKSPEKVLDELVAIRRHYPDVAVAMTDNLMPASYHKDLLPMLGGRKDTPNICLYYIKANLKLRDLMNLKKAKVSTIIPGIEALSTGLLKLLNKGVSAKNNILLLRNAQAVGINLFWFMLWGMPGDKAKYYEDILKILPLIRHLQPPKKFFRVNIERFSLYFESPSDYNIEKMRPWEVYKMIYPEWADIDNLAFCFTAEYPCEAYDRPDIIKNIVDELANWRKSYKNSFLTMVPFADFFVVHDGRNIAGIKESHTLDEVCAKEIMDCRVYNESENQKWAVEQKLGVVVDSWYVPLVTSSPELLLEFE